MLRWVGVDARKVQRLPHASNRRQTQAVQAPADSMACGTRCPDVRAARGPPAPGPHGGADSASQAREGCTVRQCTTGSTGCRCQLAGHLLAGVGGGVDVRLVGSPDLCSLFSCMSRSASWIIRWFMSNSWPCRQLGVLTLPADTCGQPSWTCAHHKGHAVSVKPEPLIKHFLQVSDVGSATCTEVHTECTMGRPRSA